jgi:Glycosyltransferase family 28 N-terminal domain
MLIDDGEKAASRPKDPGSECRPGLASPTSKKVRRAGRSVRSPVVGTKAGSRGGEEPFMRRIGILSASGMGHFYPLAALGRRLQSRGHEVVYLQVADFERPVRAAGLQYHPIGREDFPPARSASWTRSSASSRASPASAAPSAGSS